MPVRSRVCTYSPSASSLKSLSSPSSFSSSASTIIPASNTIGVYKPLNGTSLPPVSRYATGSRYGVSSTSLSSSSSSSSSSSYRPLTSTSSSPASRSLSSRLTTTSGYQTRGRYSTGSMSSSSLSSLGSSGSASSTLGSGQYSTTGSYRPSTALASYRTPSHQMLESTDSFVHESDLDDMPEGVPRGLRNLGNTCYMNSVLQALYSIDPIRQLAMRAGHDKLLASELSDLFKSMRGGGSRTAVAPSSLRHTFASQAPKFSGLHQQDAQEFLRYLINGVHEEFNSASPRAHRDRAPPRTASEAWHQYRAIVDDSPLVDLLVGQLCSTIVCGQCQGKSRCWDPFWDLSLALTRTRQSSCTLSDLIHDFKSMETLDSDERPFCESCKKATRSSKQIKLSRLPQVIILHLKKFSNDGYKIHSPVVQIEQQLQLDDCDENKKIYQLRACVSHHGHSASSGHYTSHCRYENRWIHFNDDRVKDVSKSFDCSQLREAYLLFYVNQQAGMSGSRTSLMSVSHQSKL